MNSHKNTTELHLQHIISQFINTAHRYTAQATIRDSNFH